jgi:glucokinase
MVELKERLYDKKIPHKSSAIIGADIGGTNSNFGIFSMHNAKPELLFSLHAKSKEVKNFPALVKQVIAYAKEKYGLKINHALFACAGVVSSQKDFSKPTNLSIEIDAHEIKKVTGLQCVYIVNDFEVIGYGLDLINPKDLVQVNKGMPKLHAQKAILGAGTGLGKCTMFWDRTVNRYVPVVSEGGHADAALQHPLEFELATFIQKTERMTSNISWEDLLSGDGIQRIYKFFHTNSPEKGHQKKEQVPHPDEIFKSRTQNKHSADTFNLYTIFYARCAKNFTLDALALGGIYIAGGIAAHNLPMFQLPLFMTEFINCGKQVHLLEEVPIYVITDYNISLYGAAYYLRLEDVCSR